MENASKALLMAGGVLIGILVLSLAVYLFATFGADSRRIQAQIDERQLTQYNAQYTIYDGRSDITIYDIISVANLAKENNDYYNSFSDYESEYKVTVSLAGIGADSATEFQDKENKQEYLKEYSKIEENNGELIYRFNCSNITYHSNGKVKSIKFQKNT